jgi:hypothetical protein
MKTGTPRLFRQSIVLAAAGILAVMLRHARAVAADSCRLKAPCSWPRRRSAVTSELDPVTVFYARAGYLERGHLTVK